VNNNFLMKHLFRRFAGFATLGLVLAIGMSGMAQAAAPTGADWFQLLTNQQTGSDNTGDGNTGNGSDLNYYYVGQTFTSVMQIRSTGPGSTAANIWIDYPSTTTTASVLTTGSFFNTWSGQVVSSTISPGVGRVFSTGANIPVTISSGTGTFGTVNWTANRPNSLARATSSPATLDINIGVIGATTESNISNSGVDLLDSAEDFQVHFWADTIRPFAETNNIASGTTGVVIDANYLFRLFDTRDGEGFSTSTANNAGGVGTGVNTATPPGTLTLTPTHFVPTSFDAYACSGVWGTNVCNTTIDPPSPLGIVGDTRNWQYNQAYQLCIANYQDLASASQNQLGEPNGPNSMLTKCFDFTTEPDIVAPQVVSETPAAGSAGNSIATNLTINVEDRKTYPAGPSGVGVATTTCAFDVWSESQATTTYSLPSALVTINPIPYGFQYVINPASDFDQNERVWVRAYACQDLVANTMTDDNWFFDTSDTDPPYVINKLPDNDQVAPTSTNIQFGVRDDGVGVDINNTVIFINGTYYSAGGGAGTVTLTGTVISFATSTDFTPFYVSTSTNQYDFNIGPLTFSDGEAIPIIIYSRDASSNLMPRVVYGLVANGTGVCPSGATFCGINTSWNGSSCVGTATTSTTTICPSSGGGGTSYVIEINATTVRVDQIDGDSVLVSWLSNRPGTGRVVYGEQTSVNMTLRPNYGYDNSTPEYNHNDTYHAVVIDGLEAGKLYYFRPITESNGQEVAGKEVLMTPVFSTRILSEEGVPIPTETICPAPAVTPTPSRTTTRPSRNGAVPVQVNTPVIPTRPPSTPTPSSGTGNGPKIENIAPVGGTLNLFGSGGVGNIRIIIY
jgi:hypothetical protein